MWHYFILYRHFLHDYNSIVFIADLVATLEVSYPAAHPTKDGYRHWVCFLYCYQKMLLRDCRRPFVSNYLYPSSSHSSLSFKSFCSICQITLEKCSCRYQGLLIDCSSCFGGRIPATPLPDGEMASAACRYSSRVQCLQNESPQNLFSFWPT